MAHNMHFCQGWSNKHQGNQVCHQTWTWLRITCTFIEFYSWRVEGAYLISKHPHLYGKQGYLNNKYKTDSYMSSRRIENQYIKQIALQWVLWMSGPHQSPSWFCMSLFYEFHCLESWNVFMLVEKSRKSRKSVENRIKQWKCMPKGKWQQIACLNLEFIPRSF